VVIAAPELGTVLADLDLGWPLTVVDWSQPDARVVLVGALTAGHAVLALVADDAREAEALAAGATEVARWPGSRAALRARATRAARAARLPWLERLCELTPDAVELVDTDVHLLDLNPGFEEVTGFAREEALGKTTAELFRSDAQDPAYYRQIGVALEQHGVWRGQLTARRRDGSVSFQTAIIASVRDPLGHEVGHLAVKRDSSRDDVARGALEGAEARTRGLMDRAADGVVVHDPDGRIVDVNPSACALFGVERAQLLGRSILDHDERDPTSARRAWSQLGDSRVAIETRWARGGDRVDVEVSMVRVRLGGAGFVLNVARDITERVRARTELRAINEHLEGLVRARTEELEAALARLRVVLDTMDQGIAALGPDGSVEVINRAMQEMLAIDPGDALPPRVRELGQVCAQEGGRMSTQIEMPEQRIGGLVVTPIELDDDERSRRIGCVLSVRDMTREVEVDRMKTDFTATVSHELRTPLTSILGFAKLARTKLEARVWPAVDDADPKVRKAMDVVAANLQIIVDEGHRLSTLIDDVLDIAKMEAGRVDWRREPIDPGQLIGRAVMATGALFDGRSVDLIAEPTEAPEFIGDPDRILQVLLNLISNAAKFTQQGFVRVTASRERAAGAGVDGVGVEFQVRDTGTGISAAEHDLIFDRFRQAGSGAMTNKPAGTGLGLPICRQIVEHHGGRIWVDSWPGRGSSFRFWMPLEPPRPAGEQAPEDS
jgi:PAS domain S-box-containing protein